MGARVLRYDPWKPRPQLDAADIVHHFSVQGGSWRLCAHVKEARGLPLVISPIVWIDKPEKYGMGEIAHLLRMADHILPNSQAECDQLAGLFNLERTLFSPIVNGVDELFFTPADPALFRGHFGIHESFVLCMGNIEERKNQLRLIEALDGTGLHLVLAGQDRESGYAALCRERAGTSVHFIGALEHGSLLQRSAYAAAEVLVLPSTLETPGLAALEAAAAGSKLALTREGCTREYFGEFVEYCDPYSVESICEAVLRAVEKPKQAGLPSFIRERYSWKRAAEQLMVAYQAVLAGR
jgi:glycosyltransferase involved in cell wall biosynthesis